MMGHKAKQTECGPAIVRAAPETTQARGGAAEDAVARFLARAGLRVIGRNVHCRGGEVDLVCLEGVTVVFVEVRLRTNSRFGGAAESITATKRRRIVHAARWWLAGAGQRYARHPCRFDAALLASLDERDIDWIRGAFDAE